MAVVARGDFDYGQWWFMMRVIVMVSMVVLWLLVIDDGSWCGSDFQMAADRGRLVWCFVGVGSGRSWLVITEGFKPARCSGVYAIISLM